jgi:hypothetical protein
MAKRFTILMDDLDMTRQSQIGRGRVKSIPDGFLHFACAERLGEANIRSSILKIIQCMRGAAHSDDVHTGKRCSQKFADFNTIHPGHLGVSDDNVVRVAPQELNRLHAVICPVYAVA